MIEEMPLTAAEMQRYVGTYNPGRGPIRVWEDEGKIRTLGGALRRVGEHEFVLDFDPYMVVTFEVVGDRAVSMAVEREGNRTVARRVSG